jgi:hypothetical protein
MLRRLEWSTIAPASKRTLLSSGRTTAHIQAGGVSVQHPACRQRTKNEREIKFRDEFVVKTPNRLAEGVIAR